MARASGAWSAATRALTAVSVTLILAGGALGNLDGRGDAGLLEQYRTRRESVAGAAADRGALPPGRVAPLDVVTPYGARRAVLSDLHERARHTRPGGVPDGDFESSDGQDLRTSRGQRILKIDPFSR